MTTSPTPTSTPEPWLRGTRTETPAVARAVLHALDLSREDIEKWTEGLSTEQVHSTPHGLPSIAFHLRHIARSVDRILTYAEGSPLDAGQVTSLNTEQEGDAPLATLLDLLRSAFASADPRIRALGATDLEAPRTVGRKQLPTTAGGALVHVGDHTQRHTGQIVTTARLLRAL
jgi:uncharacterized damage-inducible protein DinB